MKKLISTVSLGLALLVPGTLMASDAKGLNVMLTAKDTQTQMMAMVLSMKSLALKKDVRIVLCSSAGDLADKNIASTKLKPIDKSPKMLLQALIKKGAHVEVCPLYLPNANKDKSVLLDGVKVANPKKVAMSLFEEDYVTLSY